MKINVAIIGVGNAASAFIQGLYYYKNGEDKVGLTFKTLAGYKITDINIVAAIDISSDKVGKDLSEAIFSGSNEVEKIVNIPKMNVKVEMGNVLDGVIDETKEIYNPANLSCVDIVDLFKKTNTEIAVCLIPSMSDQAVKFYAEQALKANVAFINCTPTSLANDSEWVNKFKSKGIPLIGDDLQDQIGSTILHKLILEQMENRGVNIIESYALDVGGGPESLNTIYRAREIKREIKSKSIKSSLKKEADIVGGTSDYVPHLLNSRNTFIWIVGEYFNGEKIYIDMKVVTNDGANGGAILMDIIRATKVALIRGEKGIVEPICAYGFKNPPSGTKSPEVARKLLADFILGTI